ncbi:MAG: glycoside hydrolase family 43 protein [Muribaculaceae bacterium]|nr:glycoside hydrolase family 43 protein [Muribaculaceae bacterium]
MRLEKYSGLLYAVVAAMVTGCAGRKEPDEKMEAYLMVFHQDSDHGLHMAVSHDGYTFAALNGGYPVMAGDTIAEQKGIRDPHIYRGSDGAFYLAMTDLHIFACEEGKRDTEWERDGELYGWGNNRGLVLMKSDDLINWKRTNLRIDTASPELAEIGCAWAPETTYDPEAGKFIVYYTMRMGNGQNKLYYFYVNDDYDRMETLPELLFEYPDGVTTAIDGDITRFGDTYRLMYVAHDGTPGIKQAVSDTSVGPWTHRDEWVDTEKGACEAPNVWKRHDGSDRWVLMYDVYSVDPHNFGFLETSDFETFTDLGRFNEGVMKTVGFQSPKHGAVVSITASEARRLIDRWGIAE